MNRQPFMRFCDEIGDFLWASELKKALIIQ